MKLQNFILIIFAAFLFLGQSIFSQNKVLNKKGSLQKAITELSKKSDLIVVGKVSKMQSAWNKQKTRIYTNITVDVEEYVKGNGNTKSIIVTNPGGEVDGVGELYTHTPKFKSTEEVMLFLNKNKEGRLFVTNGHKGKFSVIKDASLNKKIIGTGESINDIKAMVKGRLIK